MYEYCKLHGEFYNLLELKVFWCLIAYKKNIRKIIFKNNVQVFNQILNDF